MGEADRIRGALGKLLHSLFSRIDYLALYPARVVSQSGQAVDLRPDDQRFPALEAVPLNLGLPGVEVEVLPGARVLLGFAGGDPSKQRATLWESGALKSIKVTALVEAEVTAPVVKIGKGTSLVKLSDGTPVQAVARVGDQVQAGPFGGAILKGSTLVTAGG